MNRQQRSFNLRYGAWYFFAVAIAAMVISIRYTKYAGTTNDILSLFYLLATTISHFTLLSFILYSFLFLPVGSFVKNKNALLTYSAFIASLGISILVLDTYIFDLYRFHINGFVLNLVFGGAFSDIFILETAVYVKAILFFVSLYLVLFILANFYWKRNEFNKFRHGKKVSLFIVSTLLVSHLLNAWAFAANYHNIQQASLCYPLFYPLRANSFIYKTGIIDPSENKNLPDISNHENNSLNYPLAPLIFNDTASKPNILFILIDTWQFEAFNELVTPNIYNFSKKATQFTNHYSGSNSTRGGIFSLFYSLPPLYWDDFFASGTSPVFMDKLIERGYDPMVLGSASLISPEFNKTVFAKVKNLRLNTPGDSPTDRDIRITEDFINYIDTNSKTKPFFGFLFYDTPHCYNIPWEFPHPFKPFWDLIDFSKLNNDFDREPFYNSYKNTLWFCDSMIEKVLKKVEDKGLLSNTIIIISSDHGQEFNENKHNYWGHGSNYSKYQLQVPMIVYIPGKSPETVHHFTTHYDIVPLFFKDVFQCKNPVFDYSIGKYLYDTVPQTWHIAGNRNNFAIVEPASSRINTVSVNGMLTVTDLQMNDLPDAKVNRELLNEVMQKVNRFYRK